MCRESVLLATVMSKGETCILDAIVIFAEVEEAKVLIESMVIIS